MGHVLTCRRCNKVGRWQETATKLSWYDVSFTKVNGSFFPHKHENNKCSSKGCRVCILWVIQEWFSQHQSSLRIHLTLGETTGCYQENILNSCRGSSQELGAFSRTIVLITRIDVDLLGSISQSPLSHLQQCCKTNQGKKEPNSPGSLSQGDLPK